MRGRRQECSLMHALPKEIGASNRHFGRIWPEFADA